MGFSENAKNIIGPIFVLLAVVSAGLTCAPDARAAVVIEKTGNLGIIKGVVRDNGGSPIADATVAIFRAGTSKLLKQVRSASDGSFLAKILPGTYTILAVAQGFNASTIAQVEVNRSDELVYGFRLERAGSGNTLPEKLADRNNPKWRIRAAQARRSVYQNQEGNTPIDPDSPADGETEANTEVAEADDDPDGRKGQTVVETYFAGSENGSYTGFNFATLLPVSENAEVVIAGQTGTGKIAPQRFETGVKFRADDSHQIRLNASLGRLGSFHLNGEERSLGQVSAQILDEWKVREGVILVFGLDYSRFLGAGDDFSISPRLGLQYDLNPKTRFRAAYTTQTEERSWAHAIELEDAHVIFREPVAIEDLVVESGKPLMNKSSRLEFGIERVLDNNSSIEANAFFDTTPGRGVGLTNLPFDSLGGSFSEFVSNQQGKARGVRIVYNRRLNGLFSTAAGYSFGSGQRLSDEGITDPAKVFENDYFQSFFGQFEADFGTGTNVKTVFRLSPDATVFAIDPFQGRLAIYDPSLSVLVTQSLPTLGLPFQAQAIVDARNLFDFQTGVAGEEGTLRINSQRRVLRGGILVRF